MNLYFFSDAENPQWGHSNPDDVFASNVPWHCGHLTRSIAKFAGSSDILKCTDSSGMKETSGSETYSSGMKETSGWGSSSSGIKETSGSEAYSSGINDISSSVISEGLGYSSGTNPKP